MINLLSLKRFHYNYNIHYIIFYFSGHYVKNVWDTIQL